MLKLFKLTLFSLIFLASCKKDGNKKSEEAALSPAAEKEKAEKEAIEKEFKAHLDSLKFNEFCQGIKFLNLPSEILDNIKIICKETQPTEIFANLLRNSYDGNPSPIVFTISEISELPEEKSQFRVGFSLKIPKLNAADIRKADTNNVLINGVQQDLQTMTVEKLSDTPQDGLNFQRTEFRYKIVVRGPQSTEFRNERETVMNQYQVSGKREDLALTTESLKTTEQKNQHFDWANTINVIVGNPKDGGSYLVTIVDFKTWNQGFHKVNTRALEAITRANAQNVYNFLKDLAK